MYATIGCLVLDSAAKIKRQGQKYEMSKLLGDAMTNKIIILDLEFPDCLWGGEVDG